MKARVKISLVAITMVGLFVGLAAAVQAESMYVGWVYTGSSPTSLIKAYSPEGVDQGISFTDSTFSLAGYYIQGMTTSPVTTDNNLYVSLYKAKDYRIVAYNRTTGALVNNNIYSTTNNAIRPITFDSVGNMYVGLACYAPGTDTDRGRIVKIKSDGTVIEDWGNPADSVYTNGVYASDLEIHGGYLYASIVSKEGGANGTKGAVVRYDLLGSNNVTPQLMTADLTNARAASLTFGPDGTLYTTGNNGNNNVNTVGKWTLNSETNKYTTYADISPANCKYPQDIDYFDGALYITDKQAPRTVRKYDLTATTPSWSDIVQYPASGTATGWTHGWLAFSPTAVPEPSTFVLLAAGLVGLLAYAWRKRK